MKPIVFISIVLIAGLLEPAHGKTDKDNAPNAKADAGNAASTNQTTNPAVPVVINVYPSPLPQVQPQVAKPTAKKKNHKSIGKWLDPMTILTVILAVANVALVVVSQRQFRLIRKNAVSTQRAFVFPKEIVCHQIMDATGANLDSVTITVIWENSGETPTRRLRTRLNWRVNVDLPENFDFTDQPPHDFAYSLIPPKSASVSQFVTIPAVFVNNVLSGLHKCYIYGWAEYNDVFEKTRRHRTEFCFVVNMTRNAASPTIVFRSDHYPKHNGADNDCLKGLQTS